MVNSSIDVLRYSGLEEISFLDAATLVSKIDLNSISFGMLYFPEEKKFLFSASDPRDVAEIKDPNELISFSQSIGFVAFPFSLESHPGYFIYNNLSIQEVIERSADSSSPVFVNSFIDESLFTTEEDEYTQNVEGAKWEIMHGIFSKLVIGRIFSQRFSANQLENFVHWVIQNYPLANISIFNLPDYGIWISATPEVLLSFSANEGIRSMALAGTKAYEEDFDQVSLWSSKELDEQSLVSDFVRNVFQDLGFQKVKEKGPFTVHAGNLLHLRTDFHATGVVKEDFFRIVSVLHPTSAVCGSPQQEASVWLQKKEGFDRSFFTGYSGVIDIEIAKLVVNLRTARISEQTISLFAGAGITSASIPEKEWIETGEKLKTLGRFISG